MSHTRSFYHRASGSPVTAFLLLIVLIVLLLDLITLVFPEKEVRSPAPAGRIFLPPKAQHTAPPEAPLVFVF